MGVSPSPMIYTGCEAGAVHSLVEEVVVEMLAEEVEMLVGSRWRSSDVGNLPIFHFRKVANFLHGDSLSCSHSLSLGQSWPFLDEQDCSFFWSWCTVDIRKMVSP